MGRRCTGSGEATRKATNPRLQAGDAAFYLQLITCKMLDHECVLEGESNDVSTWIGGPWQEP